MWDILVQVFAPCKTPKASGDALRKKGPATLHGILFDVDHVSYTLPISDGRANLALMEDNEAVIAITINGRAPNLRYLNRTHRVDMDWILDALAFI